MQTKPQAIEVRYETVEAKLGFMLNGLGGILEASRGLKYLPDGMTPAEYLDLRRRFISTTAFYLRREIRELRRMGFDVPSHWASCLPRPSGQGTMIQSDRPVYGWGLANMDEVADFEVEVQLAIKALGAGAQTPTAGGKKSSKLEWLAKAMMLVMKNPERSDAKIAGEVGQRPSTLSRSREYQAAAKIARTRQPPPSGRAAVDPDTKTRTLEAIGEGRSEESQDEIDARIDLETATTQRKTQREKRK